MPKRWGIGDRVTSLRSDGTGAMSITGVAQVEDFTYDPVLDPGSISGKALFRGTRTAYEAFAGWARRQKDPKPVVTRTRGA